MSYRMDYGRLGEVKRTPQGGYAIPADLTRAGVFTYHTDGGTVREWRPRAEVSRQATLDSLKGSPFTVGHPKPGEIRPDNFARFARGHVGEDVRMDGDKTTATIYAQDAEAIRAIESGRRDISCGYHQDTDETSGIVPEGEPDAGQRYDRIQRNILYNHTAIVPHGRAGSGIRLRLDSNGDVELQGDDMADKIEIIGGVEYAVGSDAHRAARVRQDEADKAGSAELVRLRADHDKMKAERDAAVVAKDKADKDIADALSPVRLDEAVAERSAVVDIARAHLGKDWKADGLSIRDIKLKVLAKVYPKGEIADTLRTDAADAPVSPDYLRALWAGIATQPTKRNDSLDRVRQAAVPAVIPNSRGGITRIRQDAMDETESQWQRPLSISRRSAQLQSTQIETQR